MRKIFSKSVCVFFSGLVFCTNAVAKPQSVEKLFLVTKQGQSVYDKERHDVGNQLLLYVSVNSSDTVVDEVPVVIEAVAQTAENEITDNISKNIDLPELVYESVQNISKKVFAIHSAKTKKEFVKAQNEYNKVFEQCDTMISIHGFRLIKHLYTFQNNKV